jgi:hypothetical protein
VNTQALPTIQMFWHGAPLSRVEKLSLTSFVRNGHPVDLYVYDELAEVPGGVRLMDANHILPRASLFRHRRTQSLALFADWFRYRLLLERGGIWADMDMVCLRPFDYDTTRIFGWQDESYINNAVLGLPAGDPLAEWLAASCEKPNRLLPYDDMRTKLRKLKRRLLRGNRRSDVRWGESGPAGLTSAARHLGYADSALPSWHFYPVSHQNYRALFESPGAGTALDFAASRAVHLWNHMLEVQQQADKSARFPADSPFERLYSRYMQES